MSQVTAFIDALHRLEQSSDAEPISSLFAEDAYLSNPLVEHVAGEDNPAWAFWTSYREAFEKVESVFRNIGEGEGAALLEWTSEATVNGRSFVYDGVSVLEFGDDKIVAFRAYFDPTLLTIGTDGRDRPESTVAKGQDTQLGAAEQRAEGDYS